MSTPNRIEVNRANSQHSTGPKSEAGKQRSSLNALRHGLAGQIVVMPTEDLEAYQLHLKSFTDEYDPHGATESNLVQALADLLAPQPRRRAGKSIESAIESQPPQRPTLHQFERTVAQLRDLQKTRLESERCDLDNLLDIMEMYKSKGETYNPSEDGFVFSEHQIDASIRHRVNGEPARLGGASFSLQRRLQPASGQVSETVGVAAPCL